VANDLNNGGSVIFVSQSRIWVFASLIFFLFLYGCDKEVEKLQTAPDFTLRDLNGDPVSLKDYRGKIVLLDFWATWCAPCRLSIPELVELQKKYRDQGVVVLGISMDDPEMFPDAYILAFKEAFKMNYTILRGDQNVAVDYFGITNMVIPTLFVINREGKLADKIAGYAPGAVENSLKRVLE
jgi:cytochrome c biogenesis protein CcmG/thiol:disulfide interchange protein DsbE